MDEVFVAVGQAVAVGVAVASYGELNFHAFGFALLMASIACEAVRVVSIQLLLTAADIKLNSVTTLYYVSPACFAFLTVPFVFLELPRLLTADDVNVNHVLGCGVEPQVARAVVAGRWFAFPQFF